MTYKFLAQSLRPGQYEPEGIYLTLPLPGACRVIQPWGEQHEYYRSFQYNGIPLKGHNGIDLSVSAVLPVLAVDDGSVMEIGREAGGYERYLKLEHPWGESFYANVGQIHVDAGQFVERGMALATTNFRFSHEKHHQSYLHFGIRIKPYNRFDGWGGFVDPIPFLDPSRLIFPHAESISQTDEHFFPHPMMIENKTSRRP